MGVPRYPKMTSFEMPKIWSGQKHRQGRPKPRCESSEFDPVAKGPNSQDLRVKPPPTPNIKISKYQNIKISGLRPRGQICKWNGLSGPWCKKMQIRGDRDHGTPAVKTCKRPYEKPFPSPFFPNQRECCNCKHKLKQQSRGRFRGATGNSIS